MPHIHEASQIWVDKCNCLVLTPDTGIQCISCPIEVHIGSNQSLKDLSYLRLNPWPRIRHSLCYDWSKNYFLSNQDIKSLQLFEASGKENRHSFVAITILTQPTCHHFLTSQLLSAGLVTIPTRWEVSSTQEIKLVLSLAAGVLWSLVSTSSSKKDNEEGQDKAWKPLITGR